MIHKPVQEYQTFIRPLRLVYRHVGKPITPNFRDLTDEEKSLYGEYNYFKFEMFGPEKFPTKGSFWKKERFERFHYGCGTITQLDPQTAANLANNPMYYRSAFCRHCDNHFNVGDHSQFIWECDRTRVGT